MVSTRLMSSGSSSTNDCASLPGPSTSTASSQLLEYGPAKFTRSNPTASSSRPPALQTVNFLDLPQEVIEKIFGYLPFKEISKTRLVSRRINQICGYILNSTFSKLQNQMLQRFQEIKSKMPRRESARRSHYLACESDIIETVHMRLTLLQMSLGKHIERKHCCFFPGEILDEVYSILHYIKKKRKQTTSRLDLPYKVTDELFDLSTMAMEYFKEKIEPNLPEIAYFSTDFLNFSSSFGSGSSNKYCLEASNSDTSKVDDTNDQDVLDGEEYVEIPQSNMVLRKRIRKIKQGMKRYNSQLTVLRQELKVCKKKTADQQKQITDQQKQLADQQKQTLEYATRLDEYDKKNEEISRKFSTLLQELNKCKTELQYWRCKSPATPSVCTTCGTPVVPPPEELQVLANQGINPEGLGLDLISDFGAGSAIVEQSGSKLIDVDKAAKIDMIDHCTSINKNADAPIKLKKKDETPPSQAARSSKRKSSAEERDDDCNQQSKRTRRLIKVRSKRVKV